MFDAFQITLTRVAAVSLDNHNIQNMRKQQKFLDDKSGIVSRALQSLLMIP